MSRRVRLVYVQDGQERRVVMLTIGRGGTVERCSVPATNWNAWSAKKRAFATCVGLINDQIIRGRSLRAQTQHHEAMLSLLKQLEAAELLAQAPTEGCA